MNNIDLLELVKDDGGKYRVDNLKDAFAFCNKIAFSHYENFPVASILLPKKERQHILNVYAFARIADDIGDELKAESIEKINALDSYEQLFKIDYNSQKGNPIFVALFDTIKSLNLPKDPFIKLLKAFKMDSDFDQPKTYEDIEKYCHFSANPVGELVLRIFNLWNLETEKYSNSVCTGLQTANFWQDMSVDLANGRCYVPSETLQDYGIENLLSANEDDFLAMQFELCNYAESLLLDGGKLIPLLKPFKLKLEIALTIEGGLAIIGKTRKLGYKILTERPKLNKYDFLLIFIKSFLFHRFLF